MLFVICSCSTAKVWAWGRIGHGIVAEIAFSMLDDTTKSKVKKYIGDMTIQNAANWMDDMRSDRKFDYMKPWHYVNVDKGQVYQDTKDPNVINQLNRVINELQHREKLSDDEIRTDILVLFHLIGDMHQPLHDGYEEDKGGNTVRVDFKGNGTNLHRVWDSEIIESEKISSADCLRLMKTFTKDDITMFSAIDPLAWMRQPRSQLASVYNFKDDKIDDEYVLRNKKLIEEDLLLGGIRLAAVLRVAFHS